MLRQPTLLFAALSFAAGPAAAVLVTHVFGGATDGGGAFSGRLTYDTDAPLGLHLAPYDPAIGFEVTFSNDDFFGDATIASDDDSSFLVDVSDTGLSVSARPFPASPTSVGVGLRDASGATFSEGVLPESLSLQDLDEALLVARVEIGPQRLDILHPITSLRTIPEPGTASLLALGLLGLSRRRPGSRMNG